MKTILARSLVFWNGVPSGVYKEELDSWTTSVSYWTGDMWMNKVWRWLLFLCLFAFAGLVPWAVTSRVRCLAILLYENYPY